MNKLPTLLLIGLLFGILFLATVDNSLLIPLLPMVSQDLGTTIEKLGWLFSGYALSAAVFNLLLGPVTDRLGRVPFLRLGLLAFAGLSVAAFLSRGFGQLLAVRALAGLAGGLLSTCVASLVGDLFPYHRRGQVMGAVLSAYFAALILGVPLGVLAAERWGWRSVFVGTGVLAGLLLLGSLIGFPPEPKKGGSADLDAFACYPTFLKRRATLGGLACSFMVSGATLSFMTFISGLGVTPGQISVLLLVSGVAAMAGSPLSGWLSDKLTKRVVFLISNTLLALPLLLLSRISWGVGLGALFFGASLLVASRQTSLQTVQTELVPTDQRGAFMGMRNGFSQLGIAISVFVAARIFGAYGYAGVTVFSAILTLAGSAIFFVTVPEPVQEPISCPLKADD